MMSIFEIYEFKESAVYPKMDFREKCMSLLKEAETSDKEWIEAGEKAPSSDVLLNFLTGRTKSFNHLWKKTLAKGLGYKSIKELMGDERD